MNHNSAYIATNPSDGRVTLQASSPEHAASSLIHVPLDLCDGRTLELVLGGPPLELAWRVIDETGRPVPGAFVSCGGAHGFMPPAGEIVFESPWLAETRTDDDGAFVLAGLEHAPQFVRIFADGFSLAVAGLRAFARRSDGPPRPPLATLRSGSRSP